MLYGQQVTVVDEPARDHRRAARRAADRLGRGAADLGEAEGGARGAGRRLTRRRSSRRGEARRSERKLGLDECRWTIAGAAPTPIEVLEYFTALGIPIGEVWGMSELTCIATVNTPGQRSSSARSGAPLPGVEVKLADDGELLARGPTLMQGYRNDPEKTAEAIDDDGWMHTGDVAEIDDDGYVKIVDRKKELIINAAGKNMSPANIEARLKTSSPLIGQAMRDRRPPPLQRRAARARPRRRAPSGPSEQRARGRLGGGDLAADDGVQRRDRPRRRGGQHPPQPRRADQALRDPARPTGCPAATSSRRR